MGRSSAAGIDVDDVRSKDELTIQEKDQEIGELRSQLEIETDKVKQQVEQMKLLEAELKEVQQWKENQVNEQSQSTLSGKVQNEYERQIEMLSLKLEAAELAAKTNRSGKGAESASEGAQQLKSELETVRKRYAKLSIQLATMSTDSDEEGVRLQKQLEDDIDQAMQSVFQTTVESIEEEWEVKYQTLQQQLDEVTQYTETVKEERDAALIRLEESSSNDRQQDLREKLTDELTDELTEKISEQLTEELTAKIEKRLRKKYKKMKKELESKASDVNNEQMLQAELEKMKDQYEAEYATKLQQLQEQNEEQLALQQEKMRKLVRALVEREANEKKKGSKAKKAGEKPKVSSTNDQKVKKKSSKKEANTGKSDEELVTTSTMSSSAKKRRTQTGVSPIRGNAVK